MEKLVMIPGPTPVVRSIQDEMGREIQAFGDPRFVSDYKEVIDSLGHMVGCKGASFVVAGTGTLAMEMAIANVTKPGDNVLIISHGFFGDRFIEICERKDLQVDMLQSEWGKILPLTEIEAKLKEKYYATVTVTHVDTSTGVRAPIQDIGELLTQYPDTIYIVDGVCATGAEIENMAEMHIDILFTATQKAFGVCPGLFMLWASEKALARRKSFAKIPEYYVDFLKWLPVMEDPRKYFATPAINLVWALKESVRIIKEEGLKSRYERHEKHARAVQKALETVGFKILAEPAHRAVTLSNVIYPDGVNDLAFRAKLYELGVMVAGGLGPYAGKMFRLGHMGNITMHDLVAVLSVIEQALVSFGKPIKPGTAVGTYLEEINA